MPKLSKVLKQCRLVMLEDIVEAKGNILKKFDIKDSKIYKDMPETCSCCESDLLTGLEVMGGYDGVLLWECDECDEVMLRFTEEKTEKYLQLAKGYWTNPEDWGYVPRSEFN